MKLAINPTNSSLVAALLCGAERPSGIMSHGRGSYLWDEEGKEYLDFVQGWAVNSLGHCPPILTAALNHQAERLLTPSPAFHNRPQLELAHLLTQLTGAAKATFVNSGAEANEAAIKLARKWGRQNRGGAYTIITTHHAFHGRTLATMAASGKAGWERLFPPYPDGFVKVPFGDFAAAKAAVDSTTVAIMIEPIQGEAGVVVPPFGYLAALRQLCDEYDLLLIADEVQTGTGRTGRFLCQEHEEVEADITTLGKGFGGGVPAAAVLAKQRAACFEPGDHGSTFGGNPLMLSAALAVVATISQPAFLKQVRDTGKALGSALAELATEFGGASCRGLGLLQALVFDRPIAQNISTAAQQHGLLLNPAQPHILRFMPQLGVSAREIDLMTGRLRRAYASANASANASG